MAATDEKQGTWAEFQEVVNMTAGEIEDWLGTEESKAVGAKDDGGESIGHASGRRIVTILRKKKSDLTDADYDHMREVIGYVHRHLAQRPSGDIGDTRWRYSLKNWGHDPSKSS